MLDSRGGDDALPEPRRLRARDRAHPDHDRQLQVERDRGGPQVRAGQGIVNSISSRRARPSSSSRPEGARYGAGVVVMAFDEQGQAETVERKVASAARLPPPHRRGRLPARGHHLRPQHPRRRDRHRGAQRLRRRLHRGDARIKARCPGAKVSGGVSQPVLLVPRQRPSCARRCTPRSSTTPSARAWTWASSTPAARGLRGDPEGAARARRGRALNRRPDATERLVDASPRRVKGAGQEEGVDLAWRDAPSRSASSTPWCTASSTSSTPTPRRRA
jgi:5-methyltetrahydrofolate--homocysteine methyltransferase